MSSTGRKLLQLLGLIPIIAMWTLANVIISSAMAGLVFIQLLSVYGWSKGYSMGAAVLVAVVVFLFIWLQPNIRNYISRRSQ